LAGFESDCHDPASKAPDEKMVADILELSVHLLVTSLTLRQKVLALHDNLLYY
jgi:hypothetical protein